MPLFIDVPVVPVSRSRLCCWPDGRVACTATSALPVDRFFDVSKDMPPPPGARRRGRHERRRQLADTAERVPPESRRGVAGGRRPDARSHEPQTADGAELRIIGVTYEAPERSPSQRLWRRPLQKSPLRCAVRVQLASARRAGQGTSVRGRRTDPDPTEIRLAVIR